MAPSLPSLLRARALPSLLRARASPPCNMFSRCNPCAGTTPSTVCMCSANKARTSSARSESRRAPCSSDGSNMGSRPGPKGHLNLSKILCSPKQTIATSAANLGFCSRLSLKILKRPFTRPKPHSTTRRVTQSKCCICHYKRLNSTTAKQPHLIIGYEPLVIIYFLFHTAGVPASGITH